MTKKALVTKLGSLALCAAMATSFVPAFAANNVENDFDFDAQAALSEYTIEEIDEFEERLEVLPEFSNPVQDSSCRLFINNFKVAEKPFYQRSTLMVPLRVIVQQAGGSYNYNSGIIDINLNGVYHVLSIGKNSYRIGGVAQKLDYAPVIVDNKTYVPWQYLERALGMKVTIKNNGKIGVATKKTTTVTPPVAANFGLVINGKISAHAPYYNGKTLMIPLRSTAIALGYGYSTSHATRSSTFSAKNINTTIFWDKNSYPVDNQLVRLECAPQLKGGVLYVPISYATKALKCTARFVENGTKLVLKR